MLKAFETEMLALTGEEEAFVILAVSGGADSMVMASLFAASSFTKLAIAHAHFGLRGSDSDADEALVQQWAQKNNIPFYAKRFDTVSFAHSHRISIEMAARELRYAWFEELRGQLGADYIAVAHNANDHAETILLNLTRGGGIRGLSGIPQKRGTIIRPMLCFERFNIEKHAQEMGVPYRIDATNALLDFSRNRIRHHVLPELKKINKQVVKQLCLDSFYIKESRVILEEEFEKRRNAWCRQEGDALFVETAKMMEDPHLDYWLYELLRPYGFGSTQMKQVKRLLYAQSGRKVFSPTHILCKNRNMLALMPKEDVEALPHVQIDFFDGPTYTLQNNPQVAALDAGKLQLPLTLRRWEQGDRFIPLGMKGFKKMSDFLIDLKVPFWEKGRQWVVCSGGEIVWVVGRRVDDRFKVNAATKKVAELSLKLVVQ